MELPNSLGGLQNLKTLDLQMCVIQSLSTSSRKLSNLEVLNLAYCSELVELPNLFGGLENLNHLDLGQSRI